MDFSVEGGGKYFWVKRSYFAEFNANYYIVYFGGYIVFVLGARNDLLTP